MSIYEYTCNSCPLPIIYAWNIKWFMDNLETYIQSYDGYIYVMLHDGVSTFHFSL